jgi:hypothetical protein
MSLRRNWVPARAAWGRWLWQWVNIFLMNRITFFVELESAALEELFSSTELIPALRKMDARLAIGLIDLSAQRAALVRRLNQAGIPLTAWLLLPKPDGYWFNLDNAPQAAARYRDFRAWNSKYHLRWQAVGLDIEPDINTLQLIARQPLAGLRKLASKLGDRARLEKARQAYQVLVEQVRADGYALQSYQLCLIVDEHRAGSTFIQRATGVLDLAVDQEVLMLYSSFTRPYGAAVLESYAPQAGAIGIGSTGGGVEMEGVVDTRPLTWEELTRDLLLAQPHGKELFIFSLEGCLCQGFLPRLAEFDWKQPAPMPPTELGKVNAFRGLLRGVLWASRHWRGLLVAVLIWWWIRRLIKNK